MSDQYISEPMLDMYIFETTQNVEQLEMVILGIEKSGCYDQTSINDIFRIMHTIKGSSSMMLFNNISSLAHTIEDVFYFLRENKAIEADCPTLSDFILESIDFIKTELEKIKKGDNADGDASALTSEIKGFLERIKGGCAPAAAIERPVLQEEARHNYIPAINKGIMPDRNTFKAVIHFEEGCEMENIRAYAVIHNMKEFSDEVTFIPENIIDSDDSVGIIRNEGFQIFVRTEKTYEEMERFFLQTIYLKELELVQLEQEEKIVQLDKPKSIVLEDSPVKVPEMKEKENKTHEKDVQTSVSQSIISVNVAKLDKLMDLVGEMVIAEAMVSQNPDLAGLELENFQKASRQLHKITNELQDMVMSVRMVPLATTFQKMQRIVRDMCKKLNKEVQLNLIGEETEVDKNIIEHISDPLMHLVRNSLDHGIGCEQERQAAGKSKTGRVTLEAKNAGSDVLIIVKDDGKGLNKEKILKRARENGLLVKPEAEMSEKEIYNLIFSAGFSTKENVTEFSGRGVGMDVVIKNIEAIGGTVDVESAEGKGTDIILKIPLTLAIIDGMNIKVGDSRYTLPITSIRESFRPKENEIIVDPDNNEMIMVRKQCYPILRLHRYYDVKNAKTDFSEGILIMVEQDGKAVCLLADELLGQQQVVVKSLPGYIKNVKRIGGIAGCTLLGDGNISLILDVGGFIKQRSAS
jgi:two-component system, chemotaxis family, sensor kinase CheA